MNFKEIVQKFEEEIKGNTNRKEIIESYESKLSKGANIEAKDDKERAPLHVASDWGKTDVVRYLVSKGANKYTKNKDGKTPYNLTYKDEIRNIL